MKRYRLLISIFSYSTFILSALYGQNSGALNGKVTAANGAPVPSASVLINDSTGFARNAVTGQDGSFTIQNLPPGTYRVEVDVPGFKRLSQDNVQVNAGTPVNLQLGLEAGSQQESVTVQGQAPLADDTSARIAHSYAGRILNELPVIDLNHEQLVEMMPGVTPPVTISIAPVVSQSEVPQTTLPTSLLTDPQRNRVWNTNGQPQQANNFLLNGVENCQDSYGVEAHVPTISSIQQMNLTTANYDVSQVRTGGSFVDPITRAGTNAMHGQIFEYHTNNGLRARDYFNPSPLPQPPSPVNLFGASVTAPIIRNRMFISLTDEEDRRRSANEVFSTVPTAPFTTGDFSSLPGVTIYNPFSGAVNGAGRTPFVNNTIPRIFLDPTALLLLQALPAPNVSGVENNYYQNQNYYNDGNRLDVRLDDRFSDKSLLFLNYGLSYYDTRQSSILGPIDQAGGSSRLRGHNGLIGYTHAFGASTFTDVRAGFTRYSNPIYADASTYSGSAVGITGNNGQLPNIGIDGILPFGTSPVYPQINKEENWNLVNNWTTRIHNNDVRFGIDYYQVRADGFQNLPYGPQGGFTFTPWATSTPGANLGPFGGYPNSLASFLLGAPSVAGINTSNYLPSYLSRQTSAYVSDRLNIWKLTLDLGLRYDYFQPTRPRNNSNNYQVYDPGTGTLVSYGSGSPLAVKSNTTDFSPHIGIAYRFNDRTVLRGGYSISNWNPDMAFQSSIFHPMTSITQVGVPSSYAVVGRLSVLPALAAGSTLAPNQTQFFSPHQMHTPYVQSWNLDVQRDLSHGILLDVAFVGNTGRDLPFTRNLNAAVPGTGVAGEPYASTGQTAPVYLRGTGFDSNYNSLQLNLTKRFSQGIALSVAYTFSKVLDYGAGSTPFLNNVNPFANYGPANFDQTDVVTFTHAWQLPFGPGTPFFNKGFLAHLLGPWELDGILRYGSGVPYTPTGSAAICNCPGNTPTANLLSSSSTSGYSQYPGYYGLFGSISPYQFGNLAFGQPLPGTFGNLGRNAVRGPSFTSYDGALSRSFVFGEHTRLQFRAEVYNIANSVYFGTPVTNVNSSSFGLSSYAMPGISGRTFQGVAKVSF
jgi:hypothetical protein